MDAIAFVLSMTFVAVVFVAFDRLVRLLGGLAGAIRYSVAPTMVDGVRSWSQDGGAAGTGAGPDEDAPDQDAGPTGGDAEVHRDEGLVVPVERITRSGHLWAAA